MQQSLSSRQVSTLQSQLNPRSISLAKGDVASKREELLEYFGATWEQYESLFQPLHDDAYYLRAERLRHPLIFYFGHTATFYINKMMLAKFTDRRVNPAYEAMFAIGVDEMSWDDLDESHYDWPSVAEVRAYRDKVKARIVALIQSMPIELPITPDCPAWLILMGIEHERIHLETSSVIMRMLPLDMIDASRAKAWPVCNETGIPPAVEWLPMEASTVSLGKKTNDQTYGWDNEYGREEHGVNDFKVSTTLISNQDFLQFVEADGYRQHKYWTQEGK
jgi:5-histidylcysteine sulfoxide synthase